MDPRPEAPGLSRRQLVLGGAGLLVLAACGDSGGGAGDTSTTAAAGSLSLVQFFGPDILRPGSPARAPFGLGDKDGVVTSDAPASLLFTVSFGGQPVGEPITVERHDAELPRPYFPLVFTPPQAGVYDVSVEVGGGTATAAIQVADPSTVAVPAVGDPMIPLDTPTTADGRGVNPICTREPACPLHEVTLTEALAAGRPVAFLISTPKFCQTQICGPVLDVLVGQQQQFGDQVQMVHAEVYTDDTTQTTTQAVDTYGLTFEPCLFLAGADGVIAHRLDNIFDAVELQAALSSLVS